MEQDSVTLRDRWLQALRSGEYKQGKRTLRQKRFLRSDTFCCLGVLCDVAGGEWGRNRKTWYFNTNSFTIPPMPILEAAGISSHRALQLTELNDIYGKSFDEIADVIERFIP